MGLPSMDGDLNKLFSLCCQSKLKTTEIKEERLVCEGELEVILKELSEQEGFDFQTELPFQSMLISLDRTESFSGRNVGWGRG